MSAFNFGAPAPSSNPPTNSTTTTGGAASNAPAFGGFAFGGGGSAAAPAPSFAFGSPPPAAAATTGAPSFAFGATATTAPAPTESKPFFAFGGGATAKTEESQPSGFAFGGAPAPSNDAAAVVADTKTAFSFPAAAGYSASSSFGGTFGAANTTVTNAGETKATPGFSLTAAPSTAGGAAEKPKKLTSVTFGGATNGAPAALTTTGFAFGATPVPAEAGAGGGFSFGGGSSSTTTPAPETKPETPGFSSTSTGTTPPAGGFSFQSPTATTPGPPAPVATPGPTPAASTTPAAAPATTPAPAAATTPAEPVVLEYQTMTVEQILNQFQQTMEQDALVYLEEARRVAEYDAILRDSQHDLNVLAEQVRRSLLEQQQVEQTLQGVGSLQQELDRTLETVEGHIEELLQAQSHLVPADADLERERAYQLALDVDARLHQLQQSLQTSTQQMEQAEERALTGDVAQIARVLHQHQNSLAHLEDVARRMDADIGQIRRVFVAATTTTGPRG